MLLVLILVIQIVILGVTLCIALSLPRYYGTQSLSLSTFIGALYVLAAIALLAAVFTIQKL